MYYYKVYFSQMLHCNLILYINEYFTHITDNKYFSAAKFPYIIYSFSC